MMAHPPSFIQMRALIERINTHGSDQYNPPSPAPIGYDPFSYPHLYPSGWNLDDAGKDHQMPENQASEPESDA